MFAEDPMGLWGPLIIVVCSGVQYVPTAAGDLQMCLCKIRSWTIGSHRVSFQNLPCSTSRCAVFTIFFALLASTGWLHRVKNHNVCIAPCLLWPLFPRLLCTSMFYAVRKIHLYPLGHRLRASDGTTSETFGCSSNTHQIFGTSLLRQTSSPTTLQFNVSSRSNTCFVGMEWKVTFGLTTWSSPAISPLEAFAGWQLSPSCPLAYLQLVSVVLSQKVCIWTNLRERWNRG